MLPRSGQRGRTSHEQLGFVTFTAKVMAVTQVSSLFMVQLNHLANSLQIPLSNPGASPVFIGQKLVLNSLQHTKQALTVTSIFQNSTNHVHSSKICCKKKNYAPLSIALIFQSHSLDPLRNVSRSELFHSMCLARVLSIFTVYYKLQSIFTL